VRGGRFNVRGAKWRVEEAGARISRRTFWGEGGQHAAVLFGAGADDCVIEDCDFVDCFHGIEIDGARNLRLINCTVRFTEAITSSFGFYALDGQGLKYHGCEVEGANLDSYKSAFDCRDVTYLDCTSRNSGNGAPEGGGWDLAYGGDTIKLIGCKAFDSNGVDVTVKTHQDFPSTVGDVEVIGFHSENAVYGFTVEAVDSLDFPNPPSNPGTRPEAKRVNFVGGIVKNATIGAFLNSQHINVIGTQFHGCEQEGVILYRNARDVGLSNVNIVACASAFGGSKPGMTIRGAQRVTIDKGLIDGSDGTTTTHRAAIEIFDKDVNNLANDITIDKTRMRNVTATGSPIIACFSATAQVVVDVWGTGAPTGSPGMHGGPGSTYRRLDTGDIYKKTDAANSKAGWVAL